MLTTEPAFASAQDVRITIWDTAAARPATSHHQVGVPAATQRCGAEDERRGHQPGDAAHRADRGAELGKARPAEALRGSEQVEHAVREKQDNKARADPGRHDGSRFPASGALRAVGTGVVRVVGDCQPGLPSGCAAAVRRNHRGGIVAARREEPGGQRVGVPHVADPVSSRPQVNAGTWGTSRRSSSERARSVATLSGRPTASARSGMTPLRHLRTSYRNRTEVPSQRAPHRSLENDAALRLLPGPRGGHLDHEAVRAGAHLERRVVEVARRPMLSPCRDGFEEASADMHAPAARTQRQPVQEHRRVVHVMGHDITLGSPQPPPEEPKGPHRPRARRLESSATDAFSGDARGLLRCRRCGTTG